MGTISPKPTEEKVIKLKYKNSKNNFKLRFAKVSLKGNLQREDQKVYQKGIFKR